MIRPQYHFRESESGLMAWNVETLIIRASDLPVVDVALDSIAEIDEQYWYSLGGAEPTSRNIAEHARLINAAELKYPVLLDYEGRIFDGMHRICKALILGYTTISARRFESFMEPDYVGCEVRDLP